MLFFFLLLFCFSGLCQQKEVNYNVHTNKKVKKMVTFKNKISNIEVKFRQPLYINYPLEESSWTEIEVNLSNDHFVIKANEAESAFMINDEIEKFWSLDGKFISVYKISNVSSKDDFNNMRIVFLDLETGEEVVFKTKSNKYVDTDNFYMWSKEKPHTILITTTKINVFEEAESY